MRFMLYGLLVVFSIELAAFEVEGEFLVGNGSDEITVIGASDFDRVQPVFAGFVEFKKGIRVRYLQMSSREIYRAVRSGLPTDIDLVMSSAVDLQVRLVNDGFARPFFESLKNSLHWRRELIQLSVEPIVSILNIDRWPELESARTRRKLAQLIETGADKRLRLTIYDPAVSGVGYLLSRQDLIQDDHFWTLLGVFVSKELNPNCCSGDMINRVISGDADVAYNVLESYVLPRLENAPNLRVLRFDDYQLAIPRTAFIPRHANTPDLANALVGYFVGEEGQSRLLPSVRLEVIQSKRKGGPIKPIRVTPALIVHLDEVNRRRFFQRWNRSVKLQ